MENNVFVSVIVPVYNAAMYLDRCIKSILNQTFKDIEVILIDDGSTDSSLSICNVWASIDSRIVVIHTDNNGQGSARNLGVSLAHGEYVLFVDSDDWIERDTLSFLSKYYLEKSFDVICFSNDTSSSKNTGNITIFKQPDIMFEHLCSHPGTGQSPCDKIFNIKLLRANPFPSIKAYEDAATLYRIFAISESVIYVDRIFYHYTQREHSTMHHAFSETNFLVITVYYEMYLFYSLKYKHYVKKVKNILIGAIKYCVGEYCCCKKNEAIEKEYNQSIELVKTISYSNLSLKNRIALFLIKHNRRFYWMLYRKRRNK